jgi:hypothetical protein
MSMAGDSIRRGRGRIDCMLAAGLLLAAVRAVAQVQWIGAGSDPTC